MASVSAALLWLLWAALPLQAQTPNRAGLVIVHGDGSVATRCVEFAEASISGAELLARSGLELRLEATGMGVSVCSIAGEGCAAPSDCFCQCRSSPCVYWSYWQLEEGEWRYSNLGAGLTQVRDGAVEGWLWGEGNRGDEPVALPALRVADICDAAPPAAAEVATLQGYGLPVTTLLVAGAPLLMVALWWWAQQRRRV